MYELENKILIIDDYPINLEILEAYLSQSFPKLNIFKAETGFQAMKIFQSNNLDLVLMDVMLPDISGFELCKMMKSLSQDNILPIVMITSLSDRKSLIEGLSNGADDFLTKPINIDELTVRVKNLLKLRKISKDLNDQYIELSHDLKLARSLLNDFLPKELPNNDDISTEVLYEPSSIIGGDFYDILKISEHQYGFFISDVKGHGASAAMIVALIKEQLYELHDLWNKPSKLINKLNTTMYRFFSNTRNDFFLTATYIILDKDNHCIRWSNAGHVPPIYFHHGYAESCEENTGLPLGVIDHYNYTEATKELISPSTLMLYTDGIFELPIFYQDERFFTSIDEINQFLVSIGIVPTDSMIINEVKRSISQNEQHDDINIITIKL